MIVKALRLLAGIVVFLAGIAYFSLDLRNKRFNKYVTSCMSDVTRVNRSNQLSNDDELTLNYIRGCMRNAGYTLRPECEGGAFERLNRGCWSPEYFWSKWIGG